MLLRMAKAMQIARRNARIYEDKFANRLTHDELAEKYAISVRQVTNVLKAYRDEHPPLRERDPLAIVDVMLEGFLADIAEATRIMDVAGDKNLSARIGALNARRASREKAIGLLQETGTLPKDLGDLHVLIDGRIVGVRVAEVLRAHDADPGLIRDIRAALRGEQVEQFALEATAEEIGLDDGPNATDVGAV